MIRIDEIYYNVFLQALQHRKQVGLHWFDPFGSTDFNDICNQPPVDGVADLRIIFWDQEPVYRDQAREFFDRFCKTYLGPKIIVTSEINSSSIDWVCDTYELDRGYYFFHGWAALDWYRGYNYSYLGQPWLQKSFHHRLICPNNIIGGLRTHRLKIIAGMAQRNLIKNNLISCPQICPFEQISFSELCHKQHIPVPDDLMLPLIIDHEKNHADSSHKIDFWKQANSTFCHVVTETVYDSNRIHLTEKTFKPIVLQQPFLLVAPQGSLAYLRSYGFRTFDTIWDETYDTLSDDQRIPAVLDICEQINQWSDRDISQAQKKVSAIVEHNYQWFYNGFRDHLWTELNDMMRPWQ